MEFTVSFVPSLAARTRDFQPIAEAYLIRMTGSTVTFVFTIQISVTIIYTYIYIYGSVCMCIVLFGFDSWESTRSFVSPAKTTSLESSQHSDGSRYLLTRVVLCTDIGIWCKTFTSSIGKK